MKKYFKGLIILSIMFLSLICFPKYANAEEDIHITEWIIDANLQENGDLVVSEDISFKFNDKYNGVYRDIDLKNISDMSDIEVALVNGNDISYFSQVSEAKNGDKGVYTLIEKSNKTTVKIYSPSKDEIKTFRVSYVLKDMAVKYNDAGLINYKFIGKDNKTSIGNLIINIGLPQKDNNNFVKLYVYAPKNSRIDIIDNQIYRLNAEDIDSDTSIEHKIVFPKDYIPKSTNVHDADKYNDIIAEEAARQKKIEQDRQRREAVKRILNYIFFVVSGISVLAFIIVMYQCRRKVNKELLRIEFRDIPEDCTPAVAASIAGMLSGSNVIFATILDLFRKGYLRIDGEDESIDIQNNDNFIIKKIKDGDMYLLSHERYFMHWLFEKLGSGNEVSTNDIKHHSKYNQGQFYESQSQWRQKVKDAVSKMGYTDHSMTKEGSVLIILSVINIVLGIVMVILDSIIGLISFAVAIPLLVFGLCLFNRLSDKGYIQYKKWISFRGYMKKYKSDFSKDDIFNSLNPTLIYALALNVGGIKSPNLNYDEDYSSGNWVFWYIMFSGIIGDSSGDIFGSSFDGGSTMSGGSFSGDGGGAGGF